jgi:anthranilate synthase component 1
MSALLPPLEIKPDRATFHRLCAEGNIVPVYADLMADIETPVSAYAKVKAAGPAFLLESIEGGEHLSRYSFIGVRPRKVFSIGPETTRVIAADGATTTIPTPADPLQIIQDDLRNARPVKLPGMPPFIGGAVGFLGYEYVNRIEPTVPVPAANDQGLPLLYFMLADSLLIFDRAKQTLRLHVNAHITGDRDAAYDAAVSEVENLRTLLQTRPEIAPMALADRPKLAVPTGNFTKEEFEKAVDDTKEFIRAGDIIQVVLSQRFRRPFSKTPLDLYRALRTVNPSPYMFLFDAGDFALVGASPEVHVRVTDRLVEIRPIAGTRPRGATPAEDVALEKDLLADAKEKAEHLMLVDLARNDIGRVCDYGSVTVPEYMIIERYSHVMHIVSQVEGRLRPDRTAFDVMRATFPAGTVSGAPKIRAMQLIAQFEKLQRGFYAGALGYFSYDGNLDSCITLRTALLKDGQITMQAGAGLVADSVPSSEYQETINKASALLKAVAIADKA